MKWQHHLGFGIIFSVIFIGITKFYFNWFAFDLKSILQMLVIILFSPLVMDMDMNHSKLAQLLMAFGIIVALFGLFFSQFSVPEIHNLSSPLAVIGIIVTAVAFFVPFFARHRGFLHSIPFGLVYAGILFILTQSYQMASLAFVAIYSHLCCDGCLFKMK